MDIDDVLRQQSGVISRRQALDAGLQHHQIRRMLRRNEWARVHHGVYVDHTGPPSWLQRAWAAVLYAAPAALCLESALSIEGPLIHVAVSRHRAMLVEPDGVRIHHLDERVLWNVGPPRLRVLDSRRRVRGRRWLRAVLVDIAEGSCSVLEHGYLNRVERGHGLPRATRQTRSTSSVGVCYRDTEYGEKLVVELDGRLFHDSASARNRDFERDLDAAVDGRSTVRLTYHQVFDRSCRTAAKIAQVLRQHGIAVTGHDCGPGCEYSGLDLAA